MIRTRRIVGAGIFACASLLSLPAAGHAVSGASITDDAGATVPLTNGLALRNMSPLITPAFDAGDARFAMSIAAPDGTTESIATCSPTTSAILPHKLNFKGAGAYTVTIKSWTQAQADDTACRSGGRPAVTLGFTLAPSVAIGQLPPVLLTRAPAKPRRSVPNTAYPIPFSANPGADVNEILVQGPGQRPEGTSRTPDPTTGAVNLTFLDPGTYVLTPRATDFGFAQAPVLGAPVTVQVKDPFDVSTASLIDTRGPRYSWLGFLRTSRLNGSRVRFQIKSRKAKKWRTVARPRVRNRQMETRFTIRKNGRYQYRVISKGNKLVAGGFYRQNFRIRTRRI